MSYDVVIGLETHIELSTKSKIFCGCSTEFGGAPNTHCCPGCVGLPGAMPKLNKAVVEYGIKAGIMTNCKIRDKIKMDRKNYVYPDLSKAYQTSQFDKPLCYDGHLVLEDGKKIRINRIHIEEDAGKLVHEGGKIFIDYNRAGVPLIEVVTEPDFENAEQVREYLETLRTLMRYADISDCKMQEGSMRCDVNISVKPKGSDKLGTRAEIKNMNSISYIVKAIEYESMRQIELIQSGGAVVQETRRFDEVSGETESMRGKEDAQDYRYFKDPDLAYIDITEFEKQVRANFDIVRPQEKHDMYVGKWELADKDATLIVKYPRLAEYFEKMVEITDNAKITSNILISQIFRHMPDEDAKENADFGLSAEELAKPIKLIAEGKISTNFTKSIIEKMMTEKQPFDNLFDMTEFASVDESDLEKMIVDIVKANEKAAKDYLDGKEKAILALVGQVMKQTKGKADATRAKELIVNEIDNQYNK